MMTIYNVFEFYKHLVNHRTFYMYRCILLHCKAVNSKLGALVSEFTRRKNNYIGGALHPSPNYWGCLSTSSPHPPTPMYNVFNL